MFEIVLRWNFLNRSFIIMCWGKVLSNFTVFDPRSLGFIIVRSFNTRHHDTMTDIDTLHLPNTGRILRRHHKTNT